MKCKVCGKEIVFTYLDVYVNVYAEDGYCSKECYERKDESQEKND